MPHEINLAWVIPVDEVQLIARLESYVKIKAAMTTFRLGVSHTKSKSMSGLPAEIVAMIAGHLHDLIYQASIWSWLLRSKCASEECQIIPEDHFAISKLNQSLRLCVRFGHEESDFALHSEIIEDYVNDLTLPASLKGKRNFAFFRAVG